jgi:type II secretory ATPase GspE/PulE/Tfp pilus assembly ATPase PilB-like protein
MVHRAAATHEIRQKMREHGILTLREEGVLVAVQGKTSLEEVLSATHCDDEGEAQPQPEPAKATV